MHGTAEQSSASKAKQDTAWQSIASSAVHGRASSTTATQTF
jgi:hypothetical protein